MFHKMIKNKKKDAYMDYVKLATLYRCINRYSIDKVYFSFDWDPKQMIIPVYVEENSDSVISLMDGKTYPIVRRTFSDMHQELHKVEVGKYYVHFLHPFSTQYDENQKKELYQAAKKIYEANLQKEKNKQKAYS